MKRGLICIVVLIGTAPVLAWHSEGHVLATEIAMEAVSPYLPEFFSEGRDTISHCSVDPDVFKISVGDGTLSSREYPDHYFDLEWFDLNDLPNTRTGFFYASLSAGHSFASIGTLPYALIEGTERLTLALAEYRSWPDDMAIQHKCWVYAGWLAHYAQDACQPLHATVNYNQYGIHNQVDAVLHRLPLEERPVIDPNELASYEDLREAIKQVIRQSNALVDEVYALTDLWPEDNDLELTNPEIITWTRASLERSCRFTAELYLTAWVQSELVELPDWHQRGEMIAP